MRHQLPKSLTSSQRRELAAGLIVRALLKAAATGRLVRGTRPTSEEGHHASA